MPIDTAQRRAEAIAIQLCEKWFASGARASWCPAMANEFADALLQARRDALDEAVRVVLKYGAQARDEDLSGGYTVELAAKALDRLREGVEG